jgi:predicted CoA-binding protein
MPTLEEAALRFLSNRRIAVAGVSRNSDMAANTIYRKLRSAGYRVFAVNPNAESVEGDRCFPDLKSIGEPVDAVVIATHPSAAEAVVRESAAAGARAVWIHRSIGGGSLDQNAVRVASELGLETIPGSCPMMFCAPVDGGHRCMRWIFHLIGREPAPAGFA